MQTGNYREIKNPLKMRVGLATFAIPTAERLRFIKQIGVDEVIIWGNTFGMSPTDTRCGFLHKRELSFEELIHLRSKIEDAGLHLFAIENVPLHFYDRTMLGGKDRDDQIIHMQNTIRNMGRAGIRIFGYNWMPSGVWRTTNSYRLRGCALGTGFDQRYVENAPYSHDRDYSEAEFWEYYEYFLQRVIPVAEQENVKLALHPNDAPVAKIAGIPFLFRNFDSFNKALQLVQSTYHGLAFCLGCWSEMGENLIKSIRYFGTRKKLFYIHFQSVNGYVPVFHENFIDEADYNAYEIIKALADIDFNGVMIPGHVPQIEGDTEWRTMESETFTPYHHPMGGHRARAYTIGYLKGLLHAHNNESQKQ